MSVVNGKDTERRLYVLRGSVFFSLVCSTVVFGLLSFRIIYHLEGKRLGSQYRSIQEQFIEVIELDIKAKKNAMLTLAYYFQSQYPNESTWPNVMMPLEVYESLTEPLIDMAGINTVSISPIVKADEIDSFNNFTYSSFEEQGYMEHGVRADGERGIFAANITTGKFYTEIDASSKQGRHDILLPTLLIGNMRRYTMVMKNSYADPARAPTVDVLLNCTRKYQHRGATGASDITTVGGVPGGFIMHPVFTKNAKGENTTVGILAAGFGWQNVLKQSVPPSARGLKAVLSSSGDEKDRVYEFQNGEVYYKPKQKSVDGKAFASVDIEFRHHSFTVKLYSTQEFVSHYRSNGPTTASIIVVSISVLTSLIFILYDVAINRQKREKEIISETKRLFVRYISHEIRTPLNTVHLGLQVLIEEMEELMTAMTMPGSGVEYMKACLAEWSSFISSIDGSTEDAISVVSDLIDFDKLTTGMMNIERGLHDIWGLVADTAKPFTVQARSKNIKFHTDFVPACQCNASPQDGVANRRSGGGATNHILTQASNLYVFGDSIKLQQVLRNLISNALKFTPEGGEVSVTGTK